VAVLFLYGLVSSQRKSAPLPYQVPGQDFLQLTHSGSPASTRRAVSLVSSRNGTSSGTAALLRVLLEIVLALVEGRRLPGRIAPCGERLRVVRDDESVVDSDHASEAAAGLAGAERRV